MATPLPPATTLDGTFAELSRDDIVMDAIWPRDFDKTNPRKATENWNSFRLDVLAQHHVLSQKLNNLQSECEDVRTITDFMDLDHMVERKDANNSISLKLQKMDEDVQKVTLLMEKFAQYLPSEPHRKAVEVLAQDILEQFLHLVRQTNKRTELLNWLVPHLQRYLDSASEMKTWLTHAEGRCKHLAALSVISMNYEAIVEKLVQEMIEKKTTHDAMVLSYRGVVVVDGVEQFFNVHSDNLAKDKCALVGRWDNVKEKLTHYLKDISTEKRSQIDNQIKMECQHCTCLTPYEIKKVGENQYTFGTSKVVRMVRQHGQSIVVRVGGGWEYLLKFLAKVDPCRSKEHVQEHIENHKNGISCDNGVVLKSIDPPDASSERRVVRVTKSVKPKQKKVKSAKRMVVDKDTKEPCVRMEPAKKGSPMVESASIKSVRKPSSKVVVPTQSESGKSTGTERSRGSSLSEKNERNSQSSLPHNKDTIETLDDEVKPEEMAAKLPSKDEHAPVRSRENSSVVSNTTEKVKSPSSAMTMKDRAKTSMNLQSKTSAKSHQKTNEVKNALYAPKTTKKFSTSQTRSKTNVRSKSVDFVVGPRPSPAPRPTKTSAAREGRSKTPKTMTNAVEPGHTSSRPGAGDASKSNSRPKVGTESITSHKNKAEAAPEKVKSPTKVSRAESKSSRTDPSASPANSCDKKKASRLCKTASNKRTTKEQLSGKTLVPRPDLHLDDDDDDVEKSGTHVDKLSVDVNDDERFVDVSTLGTTTVTTEIMCNNNHSSAENQSIAMPNLKNVNIKEDPSTVPISPPEEGITSVALVHTDAVEDEVPLATPTKLLTSKPFPEAPGVDGDNVELKEELKASAFTDHKPLELCPPRIQLENDAHEELVIIDFDKSLESSPMDSEGTNETSTILSSVEHVVKQPSKAIDDTKAEQGTTGFVTDTAPTIKVTDGTKSDDDEIVVRDLFNMHDGVVADKDPELVVPNLFRGLSEDIALLEEPIFNETGTSLKPQTDRELEKSFEYIIDINFTKVPVGDKESIEQKPNEIAKENGDDRVVDINQNENCSVGESAKEIKSEAALENKLDLSGPDNLSHQLLESIVESGQKFLDSIECEDGTTGEITNVPIILSSSTNSTPLEHSTASIDSHSSKPPESTPAETWVVF